MQDEQLLDDIITQDKNGLDDFELASGGKRFANLLIDGIILMILYIGFLFITDPQWINNTEGSGSSFSGYIFSILYYLIFETTLGKTPGKMVTGTRVINKVFKKPEFGDVLARSFLRLVPFEAFSFLGSEARGWHDKWSKTYVVLDK